MQDNLQRSHPTIHQKTFLVFLRGLAQLGARCFLTRNMQLGTQRILRFLGNWAINTLAVAVAVMILRNHISYGNNVGNLLMASLLLGILNAFVRPILMLFALPLLIFTLGLFTFVINALLLIFVSVLLPFFRVDSFGYAFLGALIISIVSVALNIMTGGGRIPVQRRPPPSRKSDDGNGPVIDV
jgi:putative membrane protein